VNPLERVTHQESQSSAGRFALILSAGQREGLRAANSTASAHCSTNTQSSSTQRKPECPRETSVCRKSSATIQNENLAPRS